MENLHSQSQSRALTKTGLAITLQDRPESTHCEDCQRSDPPFHYFGELAANSPKSTYGQLILETQGRGYWGRLHPPLCLVPR